MVRCATMRPFAFLKRPLPAALLALSSDLPGCSSPVLPVGQELGDGGTPTHDAAERDALDATLRGDALDATLPGDAPGVTLSGDAGGPSQVLACLQGAGWSWCNPNPTGATLSAVWGSSPSDVWAVGAGGAAEHWNGSTWNVVPTPTSLDLFSVWGTSSTDAWAVGSSHYSSGVEPATSVILQWNGVTWSLSATVMAAELWGVWEAASNDVWAVGASDPGDALALHYNGMTWSKIAVTGTNASVLYSVWGSSDAAVWAVGNDGAEVPEILNWNGTSWAVQYNNTGASSALPLWVWGSAANDVWAATSGTPLHFNGSEWQPVAVDMADSPGPISVAGAGGHVWGTYQNTVFEWNGSGWMSAIPVTDASVGASGLTLSSVWPSSPTDIWAVGVGGTLAHYDGTSWSTTSPEPELKAAWANAPGDAWAVGASGTALHWSENVWTTTNTGTAATMKAVWGATASDTWAMASDSTMYRWNGTAWSSFTSPTTNPLIALTGTRESEAGASGSEVWVSDGPGTVTDAGTSVGPTNSGQLYHWTGGTSWPPLPVPVVGTNSSWVNALWTNTSNDVWGAGYQIAAGGSTTGIVVHWNGSAWSLVATTPLTSGTATTFTYVWASGPNDVWVGGIASGGARTGAVIRWDGTQWSDVTPANLSGVGGIWGATSNEPYLWAHFGGELNESVIQFDGAAWSQSFALPDTWSYGNALAGSGPNDLWAVGSGGMILHHQ